MRFRMISEMLTEFGVQNYKKPVKVHDILVEWSGDLTKYAKPLDLEVDLLKLYQACFNGQLFKIETKQELVWTKLLVTIALIAHKLDVCGNNCSLIEITKLPTAWSAYWNGGKPN